MFVFLVLLINSKTHIHVDKMLEGNWIIDHTVIHGGELEPVNNTFNITFSKGSNEHEIIALPSNNEFRLTLVFHDKSLFELFDQNENKKIAEFEFFHPLFPHITATGQWNQNSVYVAELASYTSMSLSIFNKETKSTEVFTFSKDIDRSPKGFFEANFTFIATLAVVAYHFLKSEYKKRKIEIQLKKQSEIDMKKFEEEEANKAYEKYDDADEESNDDNEGKDDDDEGKDDDDEGKDDDDEGKDDDNEGKDDTNEGGDDASEDSNDEKQ